MNYLISEKAQTDIDDIYVYTALTFGLKKADDYSQNLKKRFDFICTNPLIGRQFAQIDNALYRLEYESHSIFYKIIDNNTVFILRILHQRMDPGRNII